MSEIIEVIVWPWLVGGRHDGKAIDPMGHESEWRIKAEAGEDYCYPAVEVVLVPNEVQARVFVTAGGGGLPAGAVPSDEMRYWLAVNALAQVLRIAAADQRSGS